MIKLTKAQANHAAWALDYMRHLVDPEGDGAALEAGYSLAAVPKLNGLRVRPVAKGEAPAKEVRVMIFDLEYRLTEQLPSMADEEFGAGTAAGVRRCAERAFQVIRDAHGWAFDRPGRPAAGVTMVGMIAVDFG